MYFVPFILLLNLKLFHNIDSPTYCQRVKHGIKAERSSVVFREGTLRVHVEIPNEISPIITSGSGTVTPAELSMVTNEIGRASRPRKNYN